MSTYVLIDKVEFDQLLRENAEMYCALHTAYSMFEESENPFYKGMEILKNVTDNL